MPAHRRWGSERCSNQIEARSRKVKLKPAARVGFGACARSWRRKKLRRFCISSHQLVHQGQVISVCFSVDFPTALPKTTIHVATARPPGIIPRLGYDRRRQSSRNCICESAARNHAHHLSGNKLIRQRHRLPYGQPIADDNPEVPATERPDRAPAALRQLEACRVLSRRTQSLLS